MVVTIGTRVRIVGSQGRNTVVDILPPKFGTVGNQMVCIERDPIANPQLSGLIPLRRWVWVETLARA
jgi:hypothetical protein